MRKKIAIDFLHNPTSADKLFVDSVFESSCTRVYTPVLRSESPSISRAVAGSARSLINLCLIMVLGCCLSGCGQRGPLYLPDDSKPTTVSSDQSKEDTPSTLH